MHRRSRLRLLVFVALAWMLGCGDDPTLPLCDEPFYALRVEARLAGALVRPDRVEAWQDDTLVREIPCFESECVSYEIPSGTYRIVARYGEASGETEVEVENSFACDHEPTDLIVELS